jgi:SAM-dependent methyltransferase
VSALDDPQVVRDEYASEERLAARASVHRWGTGPDAVEMSVAAVREVEPRRVLDAGCGRGNIAERVAVATGAAVVGLDQSQRMVELTRARGIDAVQGDVRALPFSDGEFDCVLAAWMLFHVEDVDEALAELARVLRPDGRLVAATNGEDSMRELRELVGAGPLMASFSVENGEAQLRRHFQTVERRDARGTVSFPDRAAAQAYVDASITLPPEQLPDDLPEPFVVTRSSCVFVATK